jgi:8-oxo-dGTP pyrophosphatase MutT (NUDIX family)
MRTVQRNIVGAFIFSSDNKILLGKNYKGGTYDDCWSVPGGGIEDGESKLEALKREILEETGIDISSSEITPYKDILFGQSKKTLRESGETILVEMKFYNYIIRMPFSAKEITAKPGDDFVYAKWFPVTDLKSLKMPPPSIETLKGIDYIT